MIPYSKLMTFQRFPIRTKFRRGERIFWKRVRENTSHIFCVFCFHTKSEEIFSLNKTREEISICKYPSDIFIQISPDIHIQIHSIYIIKINTYLSIWTDHIFRRCPIDQFLTPRPRDLHLSTLNFSL